MGMKSAACWFAPRWHVRTSALGESVARTIRFNIENIIRDNIEELVIDEVEEEPENHYTEIVLEDVFHIPIKRTLGKMKEHLTDIYRDFLRDDTLELRFRGEALRYVEPRVLCAPYYKDSEVSHIEWRKSIEFDFGDGLSVHGFAALRERANTSKAGFALFRRGRVIQGSADEGYRPSLIFGSSNSYRYQRLFGELHLEGFDVSHTKDGFRWDDNEQPFLELLREHLDSEELPLLKQAEGYRVRASRSALKAASQLAVKNTSVALESNLPTVLGPIVDAAPVIPEREDRPAVPTLAKRQFDMEFRDRRWIIGVELTDDPAVGEWLSPPEIAADKDADDFRNVTIRVSMVHPFMIRFAQTDSEDVESLLRVAAALAVAEVLARDAGVRKSGTVRRNVNDILRDALSGP